MEQPPISREVAEPTAVPAVTRIRFEPATLVERVEEARVELEALEQEIAETIAGRRAASEQKG